MSIDVTAWSELICDGVEIQIISAILIVNSTRIEKEVSSSSEYESESAVEEEKYYYRSGLKYNG